MNLLFTLPQSIFIFVISVFCIWFFCNKLSTIVNFIDREFNLGNAFGGTIILSIVTNLPEIAITLNASIKGTIDLAIGNILGGVVIQSILLVIFDFSARKETRPLSSLTNSKTSIIQGMFLIIILSTVIIGKQLNESLLFFRTTPPELIILFVWIISVISMKRLQNNRKTKENIPVNKNNLTKKTALIWLSIISIVVLVFGVLLEITSDTIATNFNINGVVFGATILALVTSLPEISGGLAFIKNKSYEPIISDIFGGNAFLPVLFLPITLITNKAVIPNSSSINIYLTSVAIIITCIYVMGMIISFPKKKSGLGYDSWVVLTIYLLSVIGMFYI